jgi:hypothetical protein
MAAKLLTPTNSIIARAAEPSARPIFAALRQQALQRVDLALKAAVLSRAGCYATHRPGGALS